MAESGCQQLDISVIVPCYNVERYLERCVGSLLSQQGASLEVIVVDDCSTDRSWDIAQELQRQDSRCRVFRQPENGGVSRARNRALEVARGSFVLLVDGDDWLYPDACRRLLDEQRKTSADLTVGGVTNVDDGGKTWPGFSARRRMADGLYENIFHESSFYACQGMFDSSCGRLFRLDVIRKHGLAFPVHLGFGEDTCFVLSYLAVAPRVAVVGTFACYAYFQHSASCVHQLDVQKRLRQLLGVLETCAEICQLHRLPEQVLLHKSKELIFAVKRYGIGYREHVSLLQSLVQEHAPAFCHGLSVIVSHGKLKHRCLARLIQRGHVAFASHLLSLW